MLLKDIQHLETAVGVNANIFYLSMGMAVGGIVCYMSLLSAAGDGLLFFSVLLLIWCDIHFDSESALSSTVQLRVAAGRSAGLTSQAMLWSECAYRFIWKKKAYINIGVVPGGGENGGFNPFGSSPFWVPFHPKTEDVTNIIPAIRAQQDHSARGRGRVAGVASSGDATLVQLAMPE